MFEELPVKDMGLGTQHVVVLTTSAQESQDLPDFEQEVLNFRAAVEPPRDKLVDESKKRKLSEIMQEEEEKVLVSKKPTPAKVQVEQKEPVPKQNQIKAKQQEGKEEFKEQQVKKKKTGPVAKKKKLNDDGQKQMVDKENDVVKIKQ